jgi:hypothetical protein
MHRLESYHPRWAEKHRPIIAPLHKSFPPARLSPCSSHRTLNLTTTPVCSESRASHSELAESVERNMLEGSHIDDYGEWHSWAVQNAGHGMFHGRGCYNVQQVAVSESEMRDRFCPCSCHASARRREYALWRLTRLPPCQGAEGYSSRVRGPYEASQPPTRLQVFLPPPYLHTLEGTVTVHDREVSIATANRGPPLPGKDARHGGSRAAPGARHTGPWIRLHRRPAPYLPGQTIGVTEC